MLISSTTEDREGDPFKVIHVLVKLSDQKFKIILVQRQFDK